jgi:ribosomal protein S12 methylthiotransferase accessory factor
VPTVMPNPSMSASPATGAAPLAPGEVSRRLARSRVLVVGLEPWGTVASVDLAAAGLGALHVLDDGQVTESDLLAVGLFTGADRGKERASALSLALSRIAPGCSVTSGALVAPADHPLVLEDTRWDLILACVAADELRILQSVARFAHAARLVSVSAHLDGLDAVIGPAVVPGRTACWNCCRLRKLATSQQPSADHALETSLLAERPRPRASTYLAPMPAFLGHALALAAIDLLMNATSARLAGRTMVQGLVDLEASFHTALPMPWCAVCGGALGARKEGAGAAPEGARVDLKAARDPGELRRLLDGVVDARTGIVQQLELDSVSPALTPEAPVTATAILSSYTEGDRCAHHCGEPEVGAGKGASPVDAMISAVGEAVERYSAERFDAGALLRAPVAEMEGDFIAPERLCLYGESQYARPDFPYTRLDPATPIDWALGRWLDTREPVFVPALPTFFNYPAPREADFCQVTSNGLAAGATLADASMQAALELIERDAFMISWLTRRPGLRLVLDDSVDPYAKEVARQLADRGARLALYLVDAGLAVPTVLCVGFGDGKRWPGATVSLAAHLSPRTAIRKAILEQGHVGPYIVRLMAGEEQAIPERPEDVLSIDDHALYYLPPSRATAFAFLGAGGAVMAADLEEPEEISLGALGERIQAAGLRVAIVDVTSPDLLSTPFRVARALGPDFQQIHFGHLLARLGNPRLSAIAPLGINPDPHPMA